MMIGERHLDQVSLDRPLSSHPHFPENVVLVCLMCNYGKHTLPYEEWQTLLTILKSDGVDINLTHRAAELTNQMKGILGIYRTEVSLGSDRTDIDMRHVYDLLKQQKWRCAITGLPLIPIKGHPLFPSLDRIENSDKEHSKVNTQLVCRFVNLGRSHWSAETYLQAYTKRGYVDGNKIQVLYPDGYTYPTLWRYSDAEIYQFDFDGSLVQKYSSITELSEKFHRQSVTECCDGKREEHRGFLWSTDPCFKPAKRRYFGVYKHGDRFVAAIQLQRKRVHLGVYDSELVAAWVRDCKIKSVNYLKMPKLNHVTPPRGWCIVNDRGVLESP